MVDKVFSTSDLVGDNRDRTTSGNYTIPPNVSTDHFDFTKHIINLIYKYYPDMNGVELQVTTFPEYPMLCYVSQVANTRLTGKYESFVVHIPSSSVFIIFQTVRPPDEICRGIVDLMGYK